MTDQEKPPQPKGSAHPLAPLSEEFLQHVVQAPSQYDILCRQMAGEILSLRAEVQRLTALAKDCEQEHPPEPEYLRWQETEPALRAEVQKLREERDEIRAALKLEVVVSNSRWDTIIDVSRRLTAAEERAGSAEAEVVRLCEYTRALEGALEESLPLIHSVRLRFSFDDHDESVTQKWEAMIRSALSSSEPASEKAPVCVRCGAPYAPSGSCSRWQEGCQGGRGESTWTAPTPEREEK